MTVFTATRAGAGKQSASAGWAQDVKRAWGTIEYGATAAPTIGDTFVMCKLPKGAMIVGGYLQGDKLDSFGAGSALLSVNIGLDKAIVTATGTTVTSASTSNALAANWSLGSDAAVLHGYKQDLGVRNAPLGGLLLTDGPLLLSDEGNAYITINASALAVTTGTLTLMVDYYMAQHA